MGERLNTQKLLSTNEIGDMLSSGIKILDLFPSIRTLNNSLSNQLKQGGYNVLPKDTYLTAYLAHLLQVTQFERSIVRDHFYIIL